SSFSFVKHTSTTELYTLSLHDALPIWPTRSFDRRNCKILRYLQVDVESCVVGGQMKKSTAVILPASFVALLLGVGPEDAGKMTADRKSTRLNSSHVAISYAVFCLKKKK